ncbi:MAG: hypothetical protein IKZ92_01600 [Muribaculaceae bacterium]|nr:hypothetical protein [Muribaculaceae bacterium]
MKKYINSLIFLLMALVSVGFASCGDDEEPKGADIVGTWALDDTGFGAAVILFQFTKDGTFYEVDKSMLNGETGVDVYHGTYSVSGDKLTVTYIYQYETETVNCTYQVDGNKLTITSDGHPSTFIRVKDSVIEQYL